MAQFIELAQNDKRVKALHKAMHNGGYSIDLNSLEKEIDSLHLTRQVRTLKTTEVLVSFQRKFLDAALQNQAYRSRLVEIKVKCFRVAAQLDEHISIVRSHLSIKYPNALKSYKTIGERRAAIDSVLEEPMAFLLKLELKDKEIEVILKDMDAAAWTLKGIMDAMNFNIEKTAKF